MQGGWEVDEELEDAAKRESVEEAGIRGEIEVSVNGGAHGYRWTGSRCVWTAAQLQLCRGSHACICITLSTVVYLVAIGMRL